MSKIATLRVRNIESNTDHLECLLDEFDSMLKKLDSMQTDRPGYLDYDAAAKYLSMPLGSLQQIVSKGDIRVYKPTGKKVYFKKADLDEFMESGLIPSNSDLGAVK